MSTTLTSAAWLRRSFAFVASAAMVFALMPLAGVATADDGTLGARSLDDACESAPDTQFTDEAIMTAEEQTATDCIGADGWNNITEGKADGSYAPRENVTRGQMASFIVRKVEAAGVALPQDPPDAFDDDDGTFHEDNINIAADLDIVQGDAEGDYNPGDDVTREQMATFINRQMRTITGDLLASGGEDLFADDCSTAHEDNVEALAWFHIVQGDNEGNYNCLDDVTRGQMSLFLGRDLSHLVEFTDLENPFIEEVGNQDLTVTPIESEINQPSSTAFNDDGRRAYSATDLDPEQTYVLELFPAENVDVDESGVVTFDSNDRVAASFGGPSIEDVNGSQQSASGSGTETTQVTGVEPDEDGAITFEIDSTENDEVVPAVYLDGEGDTDGALDLNEQGEPVEPFGIGGQKNWAPAEADDQSDATDAEVTNVNRDSDYFVADGSTYFYADDDGFRFQGDAITLAEFEGMLTVGDILDVTDYRQQEETGTSTFDVTTDDIPDIADVTAEVVDADDDGDEDDVVLTFEGSDQPDAVYDVFRDENDDGAIDAGDTQLVNEEGDTEYTFIDEPTGDHTYLVDVHGGTSGTQDGDGPYASNQVTVS